MARLFVLRLVRMGLVRVTILGGVVYYTVQEGVWSSPDNTIKVYQRMSDTIAPYVKQNMPKEITHEIERLPSIPNVTSLVKTSWNKGVMASVQFLNNLPGMAHSGMNTLIDMIKQQTNSATGTK